MSGSFPRPEGWRGRQQCVFPDDGIERMRPETGKSSIQRARSRAWATPCRNPASPRHALAELGLPCLKLRSKDAASCCCSCPTRYRSYQRLQPSLVLAPNRHLIPDRGRGRVARSASSHPWPKIPVLSLHNGFKSSSRFEDYRWEFF